MAGLFISLEPDTGLGGVFVLEDTNMEGIYEIHTLKVKCGHLYMAIMCSLAVAKSNHYYQMRGILAMGHHGFTNLIPVLAKHSVENILQITFTTMILIHKTTKKVLLSRF